ncbi:MAG: hypothetical protein AAF720_08420 [Pseudomonadota bacterium]
MADGSLNIKSKRPKIAFTGEEYGYGYQAVARFARSYQDGRPQRLPDGGAADRQPIDNQGFDLTRPDRQPLFTKEQALVALRNKKADVAIVPFHAPFSGYDVETLSTMSNLLTLIGVDQISATDRLCLAVYEPQLLDIVQSAHPGSGLSTLLREQRSRWHSNENRRFTDPFAPGGEQSQQFTAGIKVDASAQYMLRERIDTVFAGPEAARRCKTKLDSLRGAGLEVSETLKSMEPHREMARLARGTLNNSRQTNTFFDPRDGKTHMVSSMSAEAANNKLYGVIMPFEVASRSSDFVIIDDDVEDTDPDDPALQTSFMVVRSIMDETLLDEKLSLTKARTKYWSKRLRAVYEDNTCEGVRVLIRFRRSGKASPTGDVEDALKSKGIRYVTVKLGDESSNDAAGPIMFDIEFDEKHLTKKTLKAVLKPAFTRWKTRGAHVLAAMPMREARLPKSGKRRWFVEGAISYYAQSLNALWISHRIKGTAALTMLGTVGFAYFFPTQFASAVAFVASLLG